MKFKTYYLAFKSPLHIGDYKPESYEISENFLRSDTIIAAIYAAWAKMGHPDWIPDDGVPPFTISSAFPYIEKKGNKYTHFFPRPKLRFNQKENNNQDSTVRKKIKKVKWLDLDYFEMVINYEQIVIFGKENSHLQAEFLSSTKDIEKHIYKDLLQRVKISRNVEKQEDSDPFQMERIYFEKAGLFFMALGPDFEKLEIALEFLQYEGFGTDRSTGNGYFELKQGEISIDTPENSELSTNLSLYTPESKEVLIKNINSSDSAFETIKRGGWITTPGYQSLTKKSIRMFTEGGIWKQQNEIAGKANIDLTPGTIPIDHKIWRCGRSIFIPVKTN